MSVQAQSVSSTAMAKVVQQPIAARTVIDFHCHHVPQQFELTAAKTAPPNQRARWDAIARKLCDEDLLLKDIREGHLVCGATNLMGIEAPNPLEEATVHPRLNKTTTIIHRTGPPVDHNSN